MIRAAPDWAFPGRDTRRTRSAKTTRSVISLDQVLQIVGALLLLAAFASGQFGWLDPQSRLYIVLNSIGSAILAALAYYERQWGFLLLEGVWTIVSVWSLWRVLAGKQAAAPH